MAMNGTITEAMRPMLLMPPRITRPVITSRTHPVTIGATPKLLCMACATELDCTELPIPKDATMPKKAKNMASHFMLSPCSR